MSDKLGIKQEMAAFDKKDRKYYTELTDEERKKFSTYLMIRWGSSVQSTSEIESYYLMSCNEKLNKHFFTISKLPALQWLCASAVSPGIGPKYHKWIGLKKVGAGSNKIQKFIESNYPHLNSDEVAIMEKINDSRDFKDLARQLGFDDKRIKDELG